MKNPVTAFASVLYLITTIPEPPAFGPSASVGAPDLFITKGFRPLAIPEPPRPPPPVFAKPVPLGEVEPGSDAGEKGAPPPPPAPPRPTTLASPGSYQPPAPPPPPKNPADCGDDKPMPKPPEVPTPASANPAKFIPVPPDSAVLADPPGAFPPISCATGVG